MMIAIMMMIAIIMWVAAHLAHATGLSRSVSRSQCHLACTIQSQAEPIVARNRSRTGLVLRRAWPDQPAGT